MEFMTCIWKKFWVLVFSKIFCHMLLWYTEEYSQVFCKRQMGLLKITWSLLISLNGIHDCVLGQSCWAHSLGCEATQQMNSLRMLYFGHAWHRTDGSTHLLFSGQAFFFLPDAPNKGKGDWSERKTWPQSSIVQSLYLLQNILLSLMFFLERSGFLTDTRPSC